MFKPIAMVKIEAVLLERHVAALAEALGRLGVVHLAQSRWGEGRISLDPVNRAARLAWLDARIQRTAALLERLGLPETDGAIRKRVFDEAELERELEALEKRLDGVAAATAAAQVQLALQQEALAVLAIFPARSIPLRDLRTARHLHVRAGYLSDEGVVRVRQEVGDRALLVEAPPAAGRRLALVAGPRSARWVIGDALKLGGFEEFKLPEAWELTVPEEQARAEAAVHKAKAEIEAGRQELRILASSHGHHLQGALAELRLRRAVAAAEQSFFRAGRICCLSGWIPEEKTAEVGTALAAATEGTGVFACLSPGQVPQVAAGEEQVPVKFRPNPVLDSFRMLMGMYGTPRYEEIEPSLFFSLSFMLMFGMMFGDAGQGLVLVLSALWLLTSKFGKARPELRSAGWLLLSCGSMATLAGLAYGSYFGYEPEHCPAWLAPVSAAIARAIPSHDPASFPRLIEPMQSVMLLLGISIGIGIFCISLGILINIVNKFRRRQLFDAVLDKSGLAGLFFYWGALATGIYAGLGGRIGWWALLLLLPALAAALKEPIHARLHPAAGHPGEGNAVMQTVEAGIELFEIVNGFFSNTLSFLRLGAFVLSHAAMCMIIYVFVNMIPSGSGAGVAGQLLVIILGNLFVIGLEGLVVTIQSTRLQFYELFSRYFSGDGVPYAPYAVAAPADAVRTPQP